MCKIAAFIEVNLISKPHPRVIYSCSPVLVTATPDTHFLHLFIGNPPPIWLNQPVLDGSPPPTGHSFILHVGRLNPDCPLTRRAISIFR